MTTHRVETQFTGGKDIAMVEDYEVYSHCIDLLGRGAIVCDVIDEGGKLLERLQDMGDGLVVS
jgi:hypothetical protein